jgi:hypothetical protein
MNERKILLIYITKKGPPHGSPHETPKDQIRLCLDYRMFTNPVYRLVDTNLPSADKKPI